ncbi:OmpA family protein [Nonomuraea typhae]|uniref:OmpA family protein n=1 Tax=Nonomuraea typhae TaxID=2603600 RepID=A0ABW7Z785_9ACTN
MPTDSSSPAASQGTGIVAGPLSSGLPIEARDIRLVRTGDKEIALQFEWFNGTKESYAPSSTAVSKVQRGLGLLDLPRGTHYGVIGSLDTADGRLSDSSDTAVEPGRSTLVTAVFAAPPKETGAMLVVIDGVHPVEVPVQPQGSEALTDDPVLHVTGSVDRKVSPMVCKSASGDGRKPAPEEYLLPSDVLFAFGSATLTPAANAAIEDLSKQVTATGGVVTVEGHTDSIGDDPANKALSRRRADAVLTKVRGLLGEDFTFRAAGYGEAKPIARNTKPDGSDDPEGRAQNRRVELKIQTAGAAAPKLEARPVATEASAAGLRAEAESVRRVAGYLLAKVKVSNPTSGPVAFELSTSFTKDEVSPGELSLADTAGQARAELCQVAEPTYHEFAGNVHNSFAPYLDGLGKLPAGVTTTVWGVFKAPPAKVTGVDVEVGGFGEPYPATITAE